MDKIKQRIEIAKACGMEIVPEGDMTPKVLDGRYLIDLPDYLNDLNAIAVAIKDSLGYFSIEWSKYHENLSKVVLETFDEGEDEEAYFLTELVTADAELRSKALLITLNKWEY